MRKRFSQLIALLLVPCLLGDPTLAISIAAQPQSMVSPRALFEQEALNPLDTHFPHALNKGPTSREYSNESRVEQPRSEPNLTRDLKVRRDMLKNIGNQKPDSLPEQQTGIASPSSGEKKLIPIEKKTSEKKPASQLEISNGALRLILFYIAGVLREDDHLIPFHDKGMNEPGRLVHHIQHHIDLYPSLRPLLAIRSEVERNRQAIEMVNLLRKLEPEPYRHAGRSARLFASLWETLTDAERVPHSIDAILMGYLVDVASGRSRPIHGIMVPSDMIRLLTTDDEEDRRPWETTLLQHPEWMLDISFHMVDLGPEVEELGRFTDDDDKKVTTKYYSMVLGRFLGEHLKTFFSAKGGPDMSGMPLLGQPEPLGKNQDRDAPIHMSFIGDTDGVAVVESLGLNALNQIYKQLGFQGIRPPNVVIQVSRLTGADQKMVYKITRTDGAAFVLYVPTKTEPLDEMNTLGPLSKASAYVVKFGGQFDVVRDGEPITVVAAEYLSGATIESVIENGAFIGRKPSIAERLSIEGEIVRAYFDVWIRSGRFIQDNIRQASGQTTLISDPSGPIQIDGKSYAVKIHDVGGAVTMDRSEADEVLRLFRSVFMGIDRVTSWAWNGMNDKSAFFDAIVQTLGDEDGFQFLALARPSIATLSEEPGHWAVVCVAAIDSYFHLKQTEASVAIRSAA